MTSKIKITVDGMTYSIKSDESEEYLSRLGTEIEKRLKNIIRANPRVSTPMAAILTAFECLDEAEKIRVQNRKLKEAIEVLCENNKAKNSDKTENRQIGLFDK